MLRSVRVCSALRTALAAALGSVAVAPIAHADDPRDPASSVRGIERPAEDPTDAARAVGGVLLYLPLSIVELFFFSTGAAAGVLQDRQVVPRVRDLLFSPGGEIGVFPTIFAETGGSPNFGARMIARTGRAATMLRAGYGGPDEVVVESRVRLAAGLPLPLALDFEALHDRSTDLEYLGVGQEPEIDERNLFVDADRGALYRETKTRWIVALGTRPSDDLELLLSSSLTLRRVDDPPDAGPLVINSVFAPGSVPGASATTRVFYGEAAFRIDTRATRGAPSPGAVVEGYAGTARGLDASPPAPGSTEPGGPMHVVRAGGRIAAFVPILSHSNILSLKLATDHLFQASDAPIPFTELTRQPEFRGEDTRRDHSSIVASLDYRFVIMRYLAGRLFVDGAVVGPGPGDFDLGAIRPAWGLGADLGSVDTEIGQAALAFSPDGVRFLISFGLDSGFGDRQHRD